MTSAVLGDIASLALVAILVPVATGESSLDPAGVTLVAGKAVAFFIGVSVLGVWVFPTNPQGFMRRLPILGRYGMTNVLAFGDGEYATLTVLLLALVVGLLAHAFGFHPAVGAYMAGLILKEEYFHRRPDLDSYRDTRKVVDNVAFTWIGPVFFVLLGSKLVLDWNTVVAELPQTFVLLLGIFIGQVVSAALAARYTGGMSWQGSLMVGFGMLGGAELAFVVMNIAYVQNPVLSTEAFYTLMFTAFWLNVSVPITIRAYKPYYERALARDINSRA